MGHHRQHVTNTKLHCDDGPPIFVISCRDFGEIVADFLVRPNRIRKTALIRLTVERGPCLADQQFLVPHLHVLKSYLRGRGQW